MTQLVPLRQAAECDNTMKLLRVNKDQYTKQRGHRKIFTGRQGRSASSFFSFMNSLSRKNISALQYSEKPDPQSRARVSFLVSCLFRSINGFTRERYITLHQSSPRDFFRFLSPQCTFLRLLRAECIILYDVSETYFSNGSTYEITVKEKI